jgi:N-acetylglutamate synthase-like GNAT family acetyltransferase
MHTQSHDGTQVTIRLATLEDAEQIARLCTQLGYPASEKQIEQRLTNLLLESHHALYVAERPGEPLLGWVHIYRCLLIHTDTEAQIGGLVVDAAIRRSGAGHRLMQAAEQWAREQGCWAIYLRSNVIRRDAHQFYPKMGYETVTSSVFRKLL